MANPQKENGFTAVANEILEQIVRLKLNGTQFRIVLVVWRYTYGFNRKEHSISESFLAKALDIARPHISREIKPLFEKKILSIVKGATFSSAAVIAFNKDFDKWEQLPNITPSTELGTTTDTGLGTTPVAELGTTTGTELGTQERKDLNKDLNKDIYVTTDVATNSPKPEKTFDHDSIEYKSSKYLADKILEKNSNARVPKDDKSLFKWCIHVEYMLRLDKRPAEELKHVLAFAVSDSFWSTNILSTSKFREKYDRLYMQMNQRKDEKNASSRTNSQQTNSANRSPSRDRLPVNGQNREYSEVTEGERLQELARKQGLTNIGDTECDF